MYFHMTYLHSLFKKSRFSPKQPLTKTGRRVHVCNLPGESRSRDSRGDTGRTAAGTREGRPRGSAHALPLSLTPTYHQKPPRASQPGCRVTAGQRARNAAGGDRWWGGQPYDVSMSYANEAYVTTAEPMGAETNHES